MAAIKLTYLNYKGRAELLRYILAQADVQYKDSRVEPEKWEEVMPGTEFGIPVLEFEGVVIQRNAEIAKFLAEKYNCNGSTTEEMQATADIIDATEVTWNKMLKFFWEKDEAKKAEYMKELTEDHLPTTLKKLEVQAVQNGAENGWIVGQNVTYADLAITVLLDALAGYKPELLTAFTALTKLKRSVTELPNIQKWVAQRPDTCH